MAEPVDSTDREDADVLRRAAAVWRRAQIVYQSPSWSGQASQEDTSIAVVEDMVRVSNRGVATGSRPCVKACRGSEKRVLKPTSLGLHK